MPAAKLTLSRYQIINTCFNNKQKKHWSIREILNKLMDHDIVISKRTLEMDFEAMRFDDRLGFFAPIRYCAVNKGYHYADENYSINKINLTDDEIETLLMATDLIKPYNNISLLKGFQSIIHKIVCNANHKKLETWGMVLPEIYCENSLPCNIAETIDLLLQAIRQKIVVDITIRNQSTNENETVFFCPYNIHEFQHQWYIAGSPEKQPVLIFLEVDRIERVVLSTRYFQVLDIEKELNGEELY